MPKRKEPLDEAPMRFFMRASGKTAAIIGLIFYPGVGLLLPLGLNASLVWFVTLNSIGAIWAGLVAIGWLVGKVQARDRRHLLDWTSNLRRLNSQEFEWLVGELFRREGWAIEETGRQGAPDGNIDLVLRDMGGRRRIAQCKRWTSTDVGVKEIRAFAGTLTRERLDGSAGSFVTLSGFTEDATKEARAVGIELVDGDALHRRLENVRRKEPCPTCNRPMLLDISKRGWWFRCVAPGCLGKRDLAGSPSQAVELLLELD